MNLHIEIRKVLLKHVCITAANSYDTLAALIISSRFIPITDLPTICFYGERDTGKTIARNIIDILTDGRLNTCEGHFLPALPELVANSLKIFTHKNDYYKSVFIHFDTATAKKLGESELMKELSRLNG